jgi:hypothetical protein
MPEKMRDFIEGMTVSVDVSTGDHDADHRYFGTVTEVMDDEYDKHGVTLLVQDAEPNFSRAASTLEDDLAAVIKRAQAEGQVVTIRLESEWPPRTGAYKMIGDVRPARA